MRAREQKLGRNFIPMTIAHDCHHCASLLEKGYCGRQGHWQGMVPLCAKPLQNQTTATTIQCMDQEQLANQQQQQHSHSARYITAPDYSHSNSTPTNSQAPVQ